MHLAWRWFTGLGFDQEIPHHSTFSKNRHGRFQESKLFEELFEQIVRQCVEVGLVQGKHLSVDGSFVEANAAKESRIPREQLAEAAQVNQTVRQYLVELEQQNPTEEPVHEQDQVSTTDPDSTYATKGGTPARLGYYDNYLVDNPQLRDRGSASDGSTDESGNGGRAGHAHSFHAMARTRARIGSGRHDLRERGVLAMVGGSEHHSLYANPRQHPQKEQPVLRSRAVHLSTRKQQLSLSCGAATELWWSQHAEPHLCLHRDSQTLRCVCAKSPMHQRSVSLSCHPHGRTRPATRTGVGEHARVCPGTAAKKEGGSLVRGTQESDRIASLAPAEIEVRAGAVLPGSGGPEHQATGALPQPTDNTHSGSRLLAEVERKNSIAAIIAAKSSFRSRTFSTPTPDYINYP